MTVAHEIRLPWGGWRDKSGHVYRPSFITIWHVDPERDGSDDSCGWFMRCRHGDEKVLKEIESAFTFQWQHGVPYGWFAANGEPNYSTQAIVLGMFRIAVNKVFEHWTRRADKFMQRHLHGILHFAENNCDSMYTMVNQSYGRDTPEKERIALAASCVYSWILRADRPWYRHPKWHVWHWKIQVHPLQTLRRWMLSRCCKCGGRFKRGQSVVGIGWDSPRPRWFEAFRGEREIMHSGCDDSRVVASPTEKA